jgi:hypothetical protein
MPRKLAVSVDDRSLEVSVPDDMLAEAQAFYRKMDRDMEGGWQMGPEFVERPDREQRCQIAANKLLTSLSAANETMVTLMAGYILSRLPGVSGVDIDTGGEMLNTRFHYAPAASAEPATAATTRADAGLSKREALARAGSEISAVYASGSGFRYAVADRVSGQRVESALFGNEAEAGEQRRRAFRRRYEELLAQSALN